MHALGVDFAAGGATMVVVDGDGRVVARPAGRTGRRSRRGGGTVDAVGVAVGVDHEPDFAFGFEGLAAGAPLEPHMCDPGAAAVVAEAWTGAARCARHAVCLLLGERVLAGILIDGRPLAGAHGMAGAAAWIALNPVERQDYRKFGSLAAEVSDMGIARRLSWRVQAGDHSSVLERAGGLDSITAQHVYDGARAGDGVSISVVRDTGKYIGMAVATLVATLDPEVVVLGGMLEGAGDLILEPARQECARRLPHRLAESLRIEISPLGNSAIAIGAARLAMLARQ